MLDAGDVARSGDRMEVLGSGVAALKRGRDEGGVGHSEGSEGLVKLGGRS